MFYRTRDPNREKARLRGEIRWMCEAYKRGLYDGDEHTFWREVEGHQAQLDAIEQLTPFDVRQAGTVLAYLQTACRVPLSMSSAKPAALSWKVRF